MLDSSTQTASISAASPERGELLPDTDLLKQSLFEVDRYQAMDRLIPSTHNNVTIACLKFYLKLMVEPHPKRTNSVLPADTVRAVGKYTQVRIPAFDGLFMTIMNYVLAVTVLRILRRFVARCACLSLAPLVWIGEMKLNSKDPEPLLIEEAGSIPDKNKESRKSKIDKQMLGSCGVFLAPFGITAHVVGEEAGRRLMDTFDSDGVWLLFKVDGAAGEAGAQRKYSSCIFSSRKFSGTGWDDKEKHAVNTAQYIEDFLALYDGLKNRATGEHVIHFPKARRKSQKAVPKENTAVTAAMSASPTKATTPTDATDTNSSDARTPMAALDNVQQDVDMPADMGGHGNYDDELKVSPAKPSSKRARAESEDDDTSSESEPKARRRRHKSDSSNSSVARRNTEAGSQIAQSVENLSAAMLKPIVTTEDVSYVDDVMHILENPTMLPPDPRGRLFTIVSKALTASHTQAHIFILGYKRLTPSDDRHCIILVPRSRRKERVALDIVLFVFAKIVDGLVNAKEVVQGSSCSDHKEPADGTPISGPAHAED
ncbi:hypothetical protein B0H14DRAFT_3889158 [Mycena olivaceomarginata]|nr:hypothetical protein B0H14DRAFT_3889158 [Mycena olivaceomarginata]